MTPLPPWSASLYFDLIYNYIIGIPQHESIRDLTFHFQFSQFQYQPKAIHLGHGMKVCGEGNDLLKSLALQLYLYTETTSPQLCLAQGRTS